MPRRKVLHGAVGLPASLRVAFFTVLTALALVTGLRADGPAKNDIEAEADRLALAVSDISTEIESALADTSGLDGPVGSLSQKSARSLETGRGLLARTTDLHGAALGLVREARDACGGASGIALEAAGMEASAARRVSQAEALEQSAERERGDPRSGADVERLLEQAKALRAEARDLIARAVRLREDAERARSQATSRGDELAAGVRNELSTLRSGWLDLGSEAERIERDLVEAAGKITRLRQTATSLEAHASDLRARAGALRGRCSGSHGPLAERIARTEGSAAAAAARAGQARTRASLADGLVGQVRGRISQVRGLVSQGRTRSTEVESVLSGLREPPRPKVNARPASPYRPASFPSSRG